MENASYESLEELDLGIENLFNWMDAVSVEFEAGLGLTLNEISGEQLQVEAPSVPLDNAEGRDDIDSPMRPSVKGASQSEVKTGVEKLKTIDRLTPEKARETLEQAGFKSKGPRTAGGWETFKHPDGSKVDIGPGGRVVRTQTPKYGPEGHRINKGQRVDSKSENVFL